VSADGGTIESRYASDVVHFGVICTDGGTCQDRDRSRGDFLDIALRPNGLPIVAFVRDKPMDASGSDHEVAIARASGGPRVR
jgi:hypothetical protein